MDKKPVIKKSTRATIVDQIKGESKKPAETLTPRVEFLTTGSTLLNLALSQKGKDGGVARGRIINIVGDGSSGKCIKKGSVLTSKGLQVLDDIGTKFENGITPWEEELSLTKEVLSKVNVFYKEQVSETICVKTRHGYTIEGTHNHKIAVWTENCTIEMKKLKDLKVGDVAVIVRDTQRFPTEYFPIANLKSYDLSPKYTNANYKDITLPKNVTANIGSLLGLLVGDGGFGENGLGFSNRKPWFIEALNRSLSDFNMKSSNQSKSGVVYACSFKMKAIIYELFDNPEKFTARFKYVPNCILQSPKDVQASFIRSLFDCDSYSDGKNSIEWSSASEQVAKQIHLMLLNFGIVTTLSSKHGVFDGVNYQDHTYWGITIYGPDFIKYVQEIGSCRWDLTKTLEKKAQRKSDYDSIPFLQNYAMSDRDRIRDEVGWVKNGIMKYRSGRFPRFLFAGTENLTYQRLPVFIDTYSSFEDIWDLSLYRELLKANYHFDPISFIENRHDLVDVCDVHVPDGHLFWCNGFINHNTLLALEILAHAYYGMKND